MTKKQKHQIEVALATYEEAKFSVDFSVDGFGAYAEFPYPRLMEYLHDQDFLQLATNAHARVKIYRVNGCIEVIEIYEISDLSGEISNYSERRAAFEIARTIEAALPGFLQMAVHDEDLSRFIVSEDEAREGELKSNYYNR